VTIITMKAVYTLGSNDELLGFQRFTLIIAILFFVFIVITCVNIKEKSTVDLETPTVGQMFSSLLHNDQAMAVVITIVLINCSIYITSNLVIYFFKYDFGGAGWYDSYTLFNTFGGAIQILSMMIFFPVLRKFFNTIRIFYISFGMAIAGYAVLLVLAFTNMSSVFLLFIPAFFIFAANGMLTVLTTIFLANTVDYGELKNNRRDESVIFSMQTFVVKLASGVAVLIASICLNISHLSNDTTDTTAIATADTSSVVILRMTMTVVPIAGLLIAVWYFSKKYILTDEKVAEITDKIRIKHAGE
ncbi:MAG: MFS transporter, partial [Lachnospiraceae bacterium]|nr:MFS transporter [Lachnospiraceae bacterium]